MPLRWHRKRIYKMAMTDNEFHSVLQDDIDFINENLQRLLSTLGTGRAAEAMRYSLENGGKRIRPVLCLEFARALGCGREKAMHFAAAVEFVHTYSLIHDDLPCMDDDDMRRGKPSCHKRFGEAIALLAGDSLLTHSFSLIASAPLSAEKRAEAAAVLAEKSGLCGMAGGQVLDLEYESAGAPADRLLAMYEMKTSALIEAACMLGCIAAGASEVQLCSAEAFARSLGLAFQIQDDILDITGSSEQLGKPAGSDEKNNKTTYASALGVETARCNAQEYTAAALGALGSFENAQFIEALAVRLLSRNK